MHVDTSTALVVTALLGSLALLLQTTERLFAGVAFIAAGVEALLVFDLMQLSLHKIRIDVILPSLLVVGGVVCWSRVSSKMHVTASAVVTLVGLLQLLTAIRVLR